MFKFDFLIRFQLNTSAMVYLFFCGTFLFVYTGSLYFYCLCLRFSHVAYCCGTGAVRSHRWFVNNITMSSDYSNTPRPKKHEMNLGGLARPAGLQWGVLGGQPAPFPSSIGLGEHCEPQWGPAARWFSWILITPDAISWLLIIIIIIIISGFIMCHIIRRCSANNDSLHQMLNRCLFSALPKVSEDQLSDAEQVSLQCSAKGIRRSVAGT